MNLTDFLLARFAEDEVAAREANGRVAWLTLRYPDGSMRYTTVGHQHHENEPHWFADGRAIAPASADVFYDSRRALAECEAKRRIVELHRSWDDNDWQSPSYFSAPMDEVLAALALPYADHPDYDEAWKP